MVEAKTGDEVPNCKKLAKKVSSHRQDLTRSQRMKSLALCTWYVLIVVSPGQYLRAREHR